MLQGYGVTIDLHGETFISKAGITSTTFRTVPDQPVTSFELDLPQGPDSALAANGNLCSLTKTVLVKRRVTVRSKGRTQDRHAQREDHCPGADAHADRVHRAERGDDQTEHPDQRHGLPEEEGETKEEEIGLGSSPLLPSRRPPPDRGVQSRWLS